MVYKVQILGHSFVTRFKTFIKQNLDQYSYILNLDPNDIMIQYTRTPGSYVHSLREKHLEDVKDFEPEIVILNIGSNDLQLNLNLH